MLDLLFDIGYGSIDALWLPMLVWTAIALPIFLIQRWTPGVSPHTRYWTALGLTAALPIGMIAGTFVSFDAGAVRELTAVVVFPSFEATVGPATESPQFVWTLWHSAGLLTVVAGLLAILRISILAAATRELRRFGSAEMATLPHPAGLDALDLAGRIGLDREIRIGVSDVQPSPLTFGWREPVVVLPTHLLDAPDDLRLALAHEFVHIRRRDYLFQWCEQLIGAIFFIHPLVALLRNEASVLREITCDADVLAHIGDRTRYARLLVQYSTGEVPRGRLAVGILLRENHLKKRITAMKHRLDFARLNRSKRTGLTVSVLLLAVAVVAVACSEVFVDSPSPNAGQSQSSTNDDEVFVIVEQMPELVGGLASIQKDLRYPELAKKAGISGRVIVQFIVDEEGNVTEAEIVRGIGSGLDEAALEAVRKAEFKPGMLRGKAVPVKMSLPVTFKLGPNLDTASGGDGVKVDRFLSNDIEVDHLPAIIGGMEAVQQDLRYPAVARRAGIEGRVIVEFDVDESGTPDNARVVEGVGSGLDEEAVRAVEGLRFEPALKDGKPISMKLTLPVTFRLPDEQPRYIQIEIGRNGELFLNGNRTEIENLASAVHPFLLEGNPIVMMRAGQGTPGDLVARAQEQLRSAGARAIDYKTIKP